MEKSSNTINDMRKHLFKQLERLDAENVDMDKEAKRASAMVEVSKEIINSAKVEVDFMRIANTSGSGFLGQTDSSKQLENGSSNSK